MICYVGGWPKNDGYSDCGNIILSFSSVYQFQELSQRGVQFGCFPRMAWGMDSALAYVCLSVGIQGVAKTIAGSEPCRDSIYDTYSVSCPYRV
jgi:hypothetical protein